MAQYLNNKSRMMVGQLPSLQEIYDFSSPQLQQLASSIQLTIKEHPQHSQHNQTLFDYIENINIELQQRKTLQFFQQLCAIDNPYVKKVTAFNTQFLKLAEEALAHQSSQQIQPPKKQLEKSCHPDLNSNSDAASVTSASSSHQALTEVESNEGSLMKEKTYTSSSEKGTWKEGSKKMGIGNTKGKGRNTMKDFIMNTLNKNKAQGCFVITKGGPPKPQPGFTVNQRGHLVNPSTLQPMSTKNIQSTPPSTKAHLPPVSSKSIVEVNHRNEKELLQKRSEMVEKMKGKKAEKKREKHLNNKQLVQMIRQEQTQKQKVKQQRQRSRQDKKVEEKEQLEDRGLKEGTLSNIKKVQSNESRVEEIGEEIDGEELLPLKRQECQEINEEIVVQDSHKELSTPQKQHASPSLDLAPHRQHNIHHLTKQDKQTTALEKQTKQIISDNLVSLGNQNVDTKSKAQNEKGTVIEAVREKVVQSDTIQHLNFKKKEVPFGRIVDLTPSGPLFHQAHFNEDSQQIVEEKEPENYQHQLEQKCNEEIVEGKEPEKGQLESKGKQNTVEQLNKKCYNEEYWIHIRQQAQFQIKRFKEQKEFQDNHKSKIKQSINQSIQPPGLEKEQLTLPEQPITQKSTNTIEQEVIDEYYDKKKKQLKRAMDDHRRRVIPKRSSGAVMAPPKPLHTKPTFNYLDIYPTFNHIFSVMYTKAEHQALQDVPSIMKQLLTIFSTHQNHFKDKRTIFQPAIFLPFDTSNRLQLTDPKQLLLHTESTYVNLKKMVQRLEIFNSNLHGQFNQGENRYYRVVKSKEEVYDIITSGFLRRKHWKQLPHGCSLRSSWNFFWSWSKPDIDISKLLVWQRINHFPFNKNLSRKDLLYKNLDSFRRMLKIPFAFLPLTFNLPKQYTQFSKKFHEEEMLNRDCNYWIMKPIGKSRGRGIKVISNLAELNYTDNIVVQRYITNPLLLDGYKFDMRIYVLVTSFHPLEAFVYREGFARLSTEKFSLEPMLMKNQFVHLTNFSVNKNNEGAKQSANFSGGSKISLKTLKDRLTKMNYSFTKVWNQVHQIIIKSLLGCSVSVPPFPAAFELFGYDIMIDTEQNCHIIEVNASPSLERSYLIDQIVKQSLIDDIMDIIDPPDFDKQQLLDIMSERLAARGKITPQQDLVAIARCLRYKSVRKLGEMPEKMGLFERVAPCELSGELQRMIKSKSGANNPRNID